MKKKLLSLICVFAVISLLSWGAVSLLGNTATSSQEQIQIVTSFYPVYVLTGNIAAGAENVDVVNLTENQTGCLHDYQLTTKDMRTLSEADIFVMNGGGMESFVSDAVQSFSQLEIIDASEGIAFLEEMSEHDHDHSGAADDDEDMHDDAEDDHDHDEDDHEDEASEEYNAHVWLDPDRYIMQIENVMEGLCLADAQNADLYRQNAAAYVERVSALKAEMADLAALDGEEVIIFHDAFAYLADSIGIEVVHAVEMDSETSLSTGEAALIVEEIKLHGIKWCFVEAQYENSIAVLIAGETDAKVIVVDSLVTGDGDADSYIEGMKANIELLKSILQ